MKKYNVAICALLVVALVASAWCVWRISQVVAVERAATDQHVQRIEETAQEYRRAVEEHKESTEGKVVVIRETVRREVLALTPDELASAALGEIGIFRDHAGGAIDPRAAGVVGE